MIFRFMFVVLLTPSILLPAKRSELQQAAKMGLALEGQTWGRCSSRSPLHERLDES